jgi:hypothetical protein
MDIVRTAALAVVWRAGCEPEEDSCAGGAATHADEQISNSAAKEGSFPIAAVKLGIFEI